MSGKGRKSRRRQSTHQHKATPMIQEIDEDEIPCLFCSKTDAQIEQSIFNGKLPEGSYSQWAECTSCEQWMHLECVDEQIGLDGTVSDPLWKKICNLAEWDFTCPACGEYRPIPAQLEFQNVFSRQELLAMNIPERYLLKRMSRDPSPVPTGDEIKDFEPDMEQATSPTTQLSKGDIVAAPPEASGGGGDLVVPGMPQAPVGVPGGPMAPGINQIPVGMPSGAFDMGPMMQIMNFMREQMTQQSLVQQQQQQAFMNKFFEDREKKDALDRQEREKDRQERERIRQEESVRWERMFKSSASSVAASAPIGHDTSKPATLKLPKVQLPQFDGSVLKWPEFWDLFENMVHNNPDLPKIQKLSFLKQTLTGPAAAMIASYKITESNYDDIIQQLKDRYDNKEIIKEQLYNQLHGLPVSGPKGIELRKTFDAIASIRTQFRNIGVDVDNDLFLQAIMQKLPFSVRQKLEERREEGRPWTVNLFWHSLEAYIKVLERVWMTRDSASAPIGANSAEKKPQRISGSNPSAHSSNWKKSESSFGRGTAANLLVGGKVSENSGKKKPPIKAPRPVTKVMYPCVFCESQDHFPDVCPQVKQLKDRIRMMIQAKRCFVCLRTGHTVRNCTHGKMSQKCRGCGKVGAHHQSLCPDWLKQCMPSNQGDAANYSQLAKGQHANSSGVTGNAGVASSNSNSGMYLSARTRSILQTAIIKVLSRDNIPVAANVLLDSGSNTTWMSKGFADKLNLPLVRTKQIAISYFSSKVPKSITGYDVDVEVVIPGNYQVLCTATVLENLTAPIQCYSLSEIDKQFLVNNEQFQLAEGAIPESSAFHVDLIIGQDYVWNFLTNDPKITMPSGLKLIPSKFGYLVGGKDDLQATQLSIANHSCLVQTQMNQSVEELNLFSKADHAADPLPSMTDFWDLETIGIKDSPVIKDDDRALERFNNTIQCENGRYQVTWMWKSDEVELPDNKGLAFGRFKSLTNRLKADGELLTRYNTAIQDQLAKGIIEKVSENSPVGPRVHYLPHHPVCTPQKTTTKVRIVYDASAREKRGLNSLNDCMHRGPVILPDLCGLLLRFRTTPIAILADVEKAFLQVGLQAPERDVTRFFWYRDPTNPHWENNVDIYRFCRVAFGIICSPFLLEATIKHHLNQIGTPVAQKIMDNIYVDNVLIGARDLAECQKIYAEAKDMFQKASMNLREWTSNDQEFIESLPDVDRVKAYKAKVLGLNWNLESDVIQIAGFDAPIGAVTKRQVLHMVAKIFDPLGYFSPVVFHGKVFLHKLWCLGKKWDEELDANLVAEWEKIQEILKEIPSVQIHRYIGRPIGQNTYELLIFSDALQQAYATAVYLRFPVTENQFQVQLVFSKLRLASTMKNSKTGEKEPISLPKLELLGVLIGVRAANFVMNQLKLPISNRILWTDSQCVLNWIKSPKTTQLPVFIENRLKEIHQTKDITYRYIRSAQNPADFMTRGKVVPELSELWWYGPSWLIGQASQWPEENVPELTPEKLELIKEQEKPDQVISLFAGESSAAAEILKLLNLDRFSKLRKLLGATAYFFRFVHNCRKKNEKRTGQLTALELEEAESFLVKMVQKTAFSQAYSDVKDEKYSHLQQQLGLKFGTDGFLRCYGRLEKAELPEDAKFPKLLPNHHKLTDLVIDEAHRRVFHYGESHTLAQVRLKYWVPQGRRAVFRVLKCCTICRQHKRSSFKLPPIPVLPKERVTRAQPFQYVGVDYLGPVHLRSSDGQLAKAWICLFTCLVVRAVHLELAKDLSAQQFLDCMRRFISRRGKPEKIISDNATNFKLTKATLDRLFSQAVTDPAVSEYLAKERIQWTFITELAPWQGGFYERLVGVVKSALRKGLGKKYYDYEELQTVLTEVEAVVNTRPLTYIGSQPIGWDTTITPANFLVGNRKIGLPELDYDPDGDYVPKVDSTQQLLQKLGKHQEQLRIFWDKWSADYLLSLRERFQSEHKTPRVYEAREPKLGEIVLITGDKLARGQWCLGKIVELYPGRDGKIRSAKVLTPNGNALSRPVNHLSPMEIESSTEEMLTMEDNVANWRNVPKAERQNPSQQAKVLAKQRILNQMKIENDNEHSLWTVVYIFPLSGMSRNASL